MQSLASAVLVPFLGAYSKKVSYALTVEQIERVTIDGVAVGDVSKTAGELLMSHTHTIELQLPAALMKPPPLSSWEAVETQLNASPGPDTIALWRARHTFAATLAHALRRLPSSHRPPMFGGRGADGRWCVWVVGAIEELEGQCARHGLLAEVLAVLYPHAPGWQLELVGPGMGARAGEPPHLVRAHAGLVLDAMPSLRHAADLVVAFDSGIGSLLAPFVAGWLPSLERLLALRVPLLLTAYHEGESDGEVQVLGALGGYHALTTVAINPVRAALSADALDDATFDEAAGTARAAAVLAAHATTVARAEEERAKYVRMAAAGAHARGNATEDERARWRFDWHNNPVHARHNACNAMYWWVVGAAAGEGAPSVGLVVGLPPLLGTPPPAAEEPGLALECGLARASALLRRAAVVFARVELETWHVGLAELCRVGISQGARYFDRASVDAELLAEAITDAAVAARAAGMELHLLLRFAAFVARRAAELADGAEEGGAVARDAVAGGGVLASPTAARASAGVVRDSYTGMRAFERFWAACERALANMEAHGVAKDMERAYVAIAAVSAREQGRKTADAPQSLSWNL